MEKEITFLALTIATEFPVAMIFLDRRHWQRILLAVTCVNMITHPIAWQLSANGASIIPLELAIALVEAIIFAILFSSQRSRAFIAGVTMNVVSAMIGIIFF